MSYNTHTLFFSRALRHLLRVSTLKAQWWLQSELLGLYIAAIPVPYGHLFDDLSQLTDNRLRCCKKSGAFQSKTKIPERLKHLKSMHYEHTKFLYFSSVPFIFSQGQKLIPLVLSEIIYTVSVRVHSKSAQRKPSKQ